MECNCRDLGRHFKFQQERYSPGYYQALNFQINATKFRGNITTATIISVKG